MALTADVLIIGVNCELVTEIRTAVKKVAADHREIEKEKKYWLVTAQTPSDYESELF